MATRTLITGGAGFVGSHLCRRLLADGQTVICLDDLSTGSLENIRTLMAHPHFSFVQRDVIDPFTADVAAIYHLACPASPIHYQADPIKTWKTSVLGTLQMLELAERTGAKILYTSTSEVYGDPLEHPQPETYRGHVNPIGPRSCYDEGKRAAETLCADYHRRRGVDVRIVRIFNTYGPHMHPNDGRVVSNFIVQALQNAPLTVYGDGAQTRSFQYIDDLVEGIVRMMEHAEAFLGPVNLGNPIERTVRELANLICALIPESRSRLTFHPLPADDPRQRRPDIGLAKAKLNWEPRILIEDGLRRTIDYFRANLPAAAPDTVLACQKIV